MTQTRPVFFVSDGTGITAETLGHSLLAQFPDTRFRPHRMPLVDSPDKARDCAMKIRDAAVESGQRPIVFNTLVDPDAEAGTFDIEVRDARPGACDDAGPHGSAGRPRCRVGV